MVEHGLQLAIECVLDIGNHLVASEQLGSPQSDREVIELLGQRGVLPPAFVDQVRGMPGFHNILLHDYLTVDTAVVWELLQRGPAQFREFIAHVAADLRAQQGGPVWTDCSGRLFPLNVRKISEYFFSIFQRLSRPCGPHL
jgi:uncharacterized protein YutE (UPF0331/DUF86 family)